MQSAFRCAPIPKSPRHSVARHDRRASRDGCPTPSHCCEPRLGAACASILPGNTGRFLGFNDRPDRQVACPIQSPSPRACALGDLGARDEPFPGSYEVVALSIPRSREEFLKGTLLRRFADPGATRLSVSRKGSVALRGARVKVGGTTVSPLVSDPVGVTPPVGRIVALRTDLARRRASALCGSCA
jgi:hypothetical protein